MSSTNGKRLIGLLGVALATSLGIAACLTWPKDPVPEGASTARPEGEGWVDLLDEAHASSWENITDDKDIFEFTDGMIHIFGRSLLPLRYVGYTTEQFADFDLHLEFKVARRANSGVFLRAQPNDPVQRGFEVQVLGDHGTPPSKNRCGAVYDVVTPMFNMSRPAGEWNSFDISLKGHELTVVMNGWMVIHTDLSKMSEPIGKFSTPMAELPTQGLLALQDHGGDVWYRNILIRKH